MKRPKKASKFCIGVELFQTRHTCAFAFPVCLHHAKSHCRIDRPFKRIVALLYFYKVWLPPVGCKWSATVLSGETGALIDYLWPLCLIVGKPVNRETEESKERQGGGWREKDGAKSRTLNIEALAAGLMKLTMQVNSLLEEQPPPPPTVLSSHWSLPGELQGVCVCVYACACLLPGSHAWRVLGRRIQGQKPQY